MRMMVFTSMTVLMWPRIMMSMRLNLKLSQVRNAPLRCWVLGGPNPHKTLLKESTSEDDKEEERSSIVPTIETVNVKPSVKEVETPSKSNGVKERCPWPFVFFHDPQTGMKDYQTWIVLGLLLCYIWSFLEKRLV
mmetsp:Transcript_27326/g.40471  ORF Transcript_27326/g.40471 Transcript_27326/m.40471 type:complete len:135 (+) Transcript_27326:69-473(+)